MRNTANAFEVDEDPADDSPPARSEGDESSFKLLPTSVSAVYRFTDLDDRYGIPLIPYGKLGLSYYIWWITRPDGELAEVPAVPGCEDTAAMTCAKDRARGASLGWQASIGLSLRAERLDEGAARSLSTELGIEHAGFFAELTYAKVDGFGSDAKLKVGDATWFVGMNFEF